MKILRRFICAIVIVVLAFAFTGCGKKDTQLATPENVTVSDEGVISWDEVENADYYIVVLNENKIKSNTNSYTVGSVINDFTFAVIAAAEEGSGYKNSEPSETQTFKGKGAPTPTVDPLVEGLTVSVTGNHLVGSGKSTQLTATVTLADGNTNKKVSWSVVEGGAYGSVDGNGKFTAREVTEDHDVTVRATSLENPEKYAEIVIFVACYPNLTDEMLNTVKDDYIGFEGYMDIDLYTFAISERFVRTYELAGISTHMNGERWHASYIDSATGFTENIHYRNVGGVAQQVVLSLMNDEEYYEMTDDAGEPVNWAQSGLRNNFKTLRASDFEFDETDWRYYYKGTDATLVQNMISSANPYEFDAKRFGLIIEEGEILGIYAESNPSYSIVQGYRAYEKLYSYINCGEENVTVPEITKFASNPATVGGGHIDHETLRTAIGNMQNLESYKLDFLMSSHMATGYSLSGFEETVMEDNYFFEPYTVNTSTYLKTKTADAQYGFVEVEDGYNSYFYNKDTETYDASRAFDDDISSARASFAFAPEIFTAWATGTDSDGKDIQIYYVDETMCNVASTFYYGVGNDMPLYGLFAMYYPYLSTSMPYVVVKDGYIVETYFFYFLGDMYGEVVISYSDFTDYDEVEVPETFKADLFENFVPREVPSSWSALTVIDETYNGNDEEKPAHEFFTSLFGSEADANNLPFFGEVLGDTFGFGLATYYSPSSANRKNVQSVVLYYDVPLDADRSIDSTIKKVQIYLVQNGFEKNSHGEYVKGNISVLPYDSSLDFLIYVWKTV